MRTEQGWFSRQRRYHGFGQVITGLVLLLDKSQLSKVPIYFLPPIGHGKTWSEADSLECCSCTPDHPQGRLTLPGYANALVDTVDVRWCSDGWGTTYSESPKSFFSRRKHWISTVRGTQIICSLRARRSMTWHRMSRLRIHINSSDRLQLTTTWKREWSCSLDIFGILKKKRILECCISLSLYHESNAKTKPRKKILYCLAVYHILAQVQ